MNAIERNTGIAANIGNYSDAIEVINPSRWLHTAGTPGMFPDGRLPEGIAAQTEQAWANIVSVLASAEMQLKDIIKVTTSLTRASDIPEYAKVRSQFLGELRPAFMLQVVNQLVRPGILVELEVVAAK